MAKKKAEQNSKMHAAKASPAPVVAFPELCSKTDLGCRVLLEDQILLIDVRFMILCPSSSSRTSLAL
jgi:hypothetical protein